VQIRTANASSLDRNFHLTGAKAFDFFLLNAKIFRGMNDNGFHHLPFRLLPGTGRATFVPNTPCYR